MAFSYLTRLGGAVLNRSSAIFLCRFWSPCSQGSGRESSCHPVSDANLYLELSAPAFFFGVTSLIQVDLIDNTWELIGDSEGKQRLPGASSRV